MAPLHPPPAPTTSSDRHVEASQDGHRLRQILHPLSSSTQLDDLAPAAPRTHLGQRRSHNPIRVAFRHGSVPLRPVIFTRFTTRLFRVGLSDPLRERSCLTLTTSTNLVDQPLQLGDTLGLDLHKPAQLGVLFRQLLDRRLFARTGKIVSRNSQPYARSARR